MVNWSEAPEGAVDVRTDAMGIRRFTNGVDKFYESVTEGWVSMRFDRHDWPLVEKQPATSVPSSGLDSRILVKPAIKLYNADDVPQNKYDREIVGKYDTGKCIVDVYRVLNAFGPLPPEIQHAIKKLAAPGKRGAKDERQDLLEAIQSIEARLQYLEACDD